MIEQRKPPAEDTETNETASDALPLVAASLLLVLQLLLPY